jgi:hypothetical protein
MASGDKTRISIYCGTRHALQIQMQVIWGTVCILRTEVTYAHGMIAAGANRIHDAPRPVGSLWGKVSPTKRANNMHSIQSKSAHQEVAPGGFTPSKIKM